MAERYPDFDAFWLHFVRSHTRPATQWMHTVGVLAFCGGIATAAVQGSPWPLLLGGLTFAAFALGAHPLFEGNVPENTGQPLLGVLGNFRMAWCTLRGTMAGEVARALRGAPGRR
jgi:hypothetical protein